MGDWDVTKGSSFPGQARLEFKRKREEVEIPSIDQITEMLKDVVAQNLSFKENIDPETGFRIVTWGDLKDNLKFYKTEAYYLLGFGKVVKVRSFGRTLAKFTCGWPFLR